MSETTLTAEDFEVFMEIMESIGYHRIAKGQQGRDFARLQLRAPRPINGREVGLFYSNNGYTAKLWTSFDEALQEFRPVGKDIGWAIIAWGDELAYSAVPVPRTDEFLMRMVQYGIVNKWKIDNIPLCPCCNARMFIFRKPRTRQYMFVCKNTPRHPDQTWQFRSWDYGLPEDMKDFVQARRLIRKAYRDGNTKKGKTPTPKALIRKRWTAGAPHNTVRP